MTARGVAALAVAIECEGLRLPVARARLVALAQAVLRAEGIRRALVSVAFVGPRRMAALNRRHLGHAGATDIITFALGDDPACGLVADVYICPDVARRQARGHGVGVREELARLVVHGMLHACGWDHPESEDRVRSPMWRRQERLVQRHWVTSMTAA